MRLGSLQIVLFVFPRLDPKAKATAVASGLPASPGAASGIAVFDADRAEMLGKEQGLKVILVREETQPEDIHGFFASEGILTSRGGKTSHAAVVARGMGQVLRGRCRGHPRRCRQAHRHRRRHQLQGRRHDHPGRGYARDDVLMLLRFIDWLNRLPRRLELALRQELADLEEQIKMSYVTSWERFAREEGREEGEQRGEAKALLRLLQVKFGPMPPDIESRVQTAEPAQLDVWLTRILTAAFQNPETSVQEARGGSCWSPRF